MMQNDLSQLIAYSALTEAQVAHLAGMGITTCAALVASWSDEASRADLATLLGLSGAEMIYATFVARLLLVQGPGELMIQAMLEHEDPDTLGESAIEGLANMIDLDDDSIIAILTDLAYETTADTRRGVVRIDSRNILIVFAVMAFVFLAVGVWSIKDYLWPSPGTSLATLNAYHQLRSETFITLAALMGWLAACVGVAALAPLVL